MLIVGAGVIGTVYGAHAATAGHQVSVLSHGPRAGESVHETRRDKLRLITGACGDIRNWNLHPA